MYLVLGVGCNSSFLLELTVSHFWSAKFTWMKDIVHAVITPIWNVILSILRSQIDFCTMDFILGSQNWQDYISNRCIHYTMSITQVNFMDQKGIQVRYWIFTDSGSWKYFGTYLCTLCAINTLMVPMWVDCDIPEVPV